MMEKQLTILGQQVGNQTMRNETRNICANISNKVTNTVKPEILCVTADCAREEYDATRIRRGQAVGECYSFVSDPLRV